MKLFLLRFLLWPALLTVGAAYSQKAPANLVYVDKSGVLRYTKGNREAAFWGVNYTLPFAYGYRSVKALGKEVKKEIDADVYHLARLGCDAFRVHVWDTEISDSLGNLLTNEHLDAFDYLLAQLKKRGIKTIVTPIAFWGNGYPEKDERTLGFSRVYGKGRATVNDTAIRAQEEYVRQFFQHVNPYTGTTYTADPDMIATEINNEPNHSGPKSGVTAYINRLVAAIKSVGWTKPVFYNISENPRYADATAVAQVDGVSFQWYPTGLVANRELGGNFLPNVDRYTIPFDTISAYKNKARMVYEFDAADLLQSCMYPAMARSFRSAGFQWATQFAYDPQATAYGNTEYQTHYLNLAYTPSKAISLLIAGHAFRQVGRLQTFPAYPADSSFGPFRVGYRNNLSEMNSDTAFYYSNTTGTVPKNSSALKHIAGVGSSAVVQYAGTGAYFLDKLPNGGWRLEVMPDAIHIRDPFERSSPQKEQTRLQWQANRLKLSLPGLGDAFAIRGINEGNRYTATANEGTFPVFPGTYLLNVIGNALPPAPAAVGPLKLEEFAAPQPFDTTPFVAYHPVPEAVSGQPLTLHLQAVGIDTSAIITLQIMSGTRSWVAPISFRKVGSYDYTASLPTEILVPGLLDYRIVLQTGNDYRVYPGNIPGNPYAWDYTNTATYELRVLPEKSGLPLFGAVTSKAVLAYNGGNWRSSDVRLVPTDRPGGLAYRIATSDAAASPVLGIQSFFGSQWQAVQLSTGYKTIVVRARAVGEGPVAARLTLITKEAAAFGASINLGTTFQEIEIPVSSLKKDSLLLLPRPYPGFLPLWFTAATTNFQLADAEKLQVTMDSKGAAGEKGYGMEIEAVWLKR